MSFFPIGNTYHDFERANPSPELLPSPEQFLMPAELLQQPQHSPPPSANTGSPRPPAVGPLLSRRLSTQQGRAITVHTRLRDPMHGHELGSWEHYLREWERQPPLPSPR